MAKTIDDIRRAVADALAKAGYKSGDVRVDNARICNGAIIISVGVHSPVISAMEVESRVDFCRYTAYDGFTARNEGSVYVFVDYAGDVCEGIPGRYMTRAIEVMAEAKRNKGRSPRVAENKAYGIDKRILYVTFETRGEEPERDEYYVFSEYGAGPSPTKSYLTRNALEIMRILYAFDEAGTLVF